MEKPRKTVWPTDSSVLVSLSAADCEFVSIVDPNNGAMKVYARKSKKFIPYLLGKDASYDDNLNAFLKGSILPEKREEAMNELSLSSIVKKLEKDEYFRPVYPVRLLDESIQYKRWCFTYLSEDKDLILFTRSDVTEASYSESDTISGVPSRERFAVEVQKLSHKNPDIPFYFLFIDIDDFRTYNSLFGFEKGDEILHYLGTNLSSLAKSKGLVGHVIADDFVMVIPKDGFHEGEFQKIYDGLTKVNPDYAFSISIGVSECGEGKCEYREIYERAYLANRSIKDRRGLSFAFYNESLREKSVLAQSIIGKLHKGLSNHEFEVYYQPIVNSSTHRLEMAEALVRWNSPDSGLTRPDVFIPILEKNGLIAELDHYVRLEVYRYINKRKANGLPLFPISVNLSRVELEQPGFAASLSKELVDAGLPHELLRLEITESVFVNHGSYFFKTISELKQQNFYLEMDDFGSGYSSLSILRDVPFDLIKLDMRFFSGGESEKSQAIVAASLSIAKALQMDSIAEGVEKEGQVNFLLSHNCRLIQGYFFSKPLPEAQFEAFLEKVPPKGE